MKQPKIKIFGKIHDVTGFSFEAGRISKIVYAVSETQQKSVFRSDTVINSNMTSERKIQVPTQHPYRNYSLAPNLEALICE